MHNFSDFKRYKSKQDTNIVFKTDYMAKKIEKSTSVLNI